MSFFLVYQLIWVEVILFLGGIGYIIFHSGHGIWSFKRSNHAAEQERKRERTKSLRRHTIEQKKIEIQTRRADVSMNMPKKKLKASEKQELEATIKMVKAKLAVKEYEEARAAIIRWLIMDKHNIDLNILLAQLYEKEGDYEKAEILFRDLILHHDPEKANVYIYLGNNLISQERPHRAYDIFKKWLEKEPRNIELLQTLSELGYEQHEYEESLLYSRKLSEIQPKNITAFEILGLSYLQVGSDQKAYDAFLNLRKLDPYNQIVLTWLPKIEEKLSIHPDSKSLAGGRGRKKS